MKYMNHFSCSTLFSHSWGVDFCCAISRAFSTSLYETQAFPSGTSFSFLSLLTSCFFILFFFLFVRSKKLVKWTCDFSPLIRVLFCTKQSSLIILKNQPHVSKAKINQVGSFSNSPKIQNKLRWVRMSIYRL
jgi:hypothetical protein